MKPLSSNSFTKLMSAKSSGFNDATLAPRQSTERTTKYLNLTVSFPFVVSLVEP
jgi:hypothetical protein